MSFITQKNKEYIEPHLIESIAKQAKTEAETAK